MTKSTFDKGLEVAEELAKLTPTPLDDIAIKVIDVIEDFIDEPEGEPESSAEALGEAFGNKEG